jgi:hypothetical protein
LEKAHAYKKKWRVDTGEEIGVVYAYTVTELIFAVDLSWQKKGYII